MGDNGGALLQSVPLPRLLPESCRLEKRSVVRLAERFVSCILRRLRRQVCVRPPDSGSVALDEVFLLVDGVFVEPGPVEDALRLLDHFRMAAGVGGGVARRKWSCVQVLP